MALRRIHHAIPECPSAVFVTNTDNDNTGVIGRFHYATVLRNRPQVLTTWRVTSDDLPVLDRVAELLGGTSRPADQKAFEIITRTSTVDVLFASHRAVQVRWSHNRPAHICNGATQQDGQTKRRCMCPSSFAERKVAARRGVACHPHVEVWFRLAQRPTLGIFAFTSGNWLFTEECMNVCETLRGLNRVANAQLDLTGASAMLRSGRLVTCTRPTLTVLDIPRLTMPPSARGRLPHPQ